MFLLSAKSNRLILPMFNLATNANKSFVFSSSKIINYLINHGIIFTENTVDSFKNKLKRHLIFRQSASINKDINWLPSNNDIFPDLYIS